MIVVADTSPLTALIQTGEEALLPMLFGRLIIPDAVRSELLAFHSDLPDWLETVSVANRALVERLSESIDAGEAEAIALAEEFVADLVLMDERKGRSVARSEGVQVIGLVGVVILAKTQGLIPSARILRDNFESKAGVYLSATVKEKALRSVDE